MLLVAALAIPQTMPLGGHYNELPSNKDMQYNQGHSNPDVPQEVKSNGQEAGETGPNGHGRQILLDTTYSRMILLWLWPVASSLELILLKIS